MYFFLKILAKEIFPNLISSFQVKEAVGLTSTTCAILSSMLKPGVDCGHGLVLGSRT